MRFLFSAVILVLLGPALAQAIPTIHGTYRFGGIGAELEGSCGPLPSGSPPVVSIDDGTIDLNGDGTFSAAFTNHEVCPGAASTSSLVSGGSTYQVGADGVLYFEDVPASPGIEGGALFLRADGSVALLTRIEEGEEDAYVELLIALSAGNSNASLNGGYSVVRLVQTHAATTMTSRSDLGVMTFNGLGAYTESGTGHLALHGGTATTTAYGPIAGSYAVAGNGTLTIAGGTGAVSRDGELFFTVRQLGGEVQMTVGVRKGMTYQASTVAGDYGVGSMSTGITTAATTLTLSTAYGTTAFAPLTAGSGNLLHDHFLIDTFPGPGNFAFGQSVTPSTYTLQTIGPNSGELALGPASMLGALSADGSLLVAAPRSAQGNGLMVGIARCAAARRFGTGTAGTAAITPELLTVGGFPHVGNANFGFVVNRGLGTSPVLMALSLGTSTGLPLFGGTVWIDLAQVVETTLLSMSGPALPGFGAAGWPVQLPDDPVFSGLLAAAQAFVLDAGAAQGVAMSQAVQFVVCR